MWEKEKCTGERKQFWVYNIFLSTEIASQIQRLRGSGVPYISSHFYVFKFDWILHFYRKFQLEDRPPPKIIHIKKKGKCIILWELICQSPINERTKPDLIVWCFQLKDYTSVFIDYHHLVIVVLLLLFVKSLII